MSRAIVSKQSTREFYTQLYLDDFPGATEVTKNRARAFVNKLIKKIKQNVLVASNLPKDLEISQSLYSQLIAKVAPSKKPSVVIKKKDVSTQDKVDALAEAMEAMLDEASEQLDESEDIIEDVEETLENEIIQQRVGDKRIDELEQYVEDIKRRRLEQEEPQNIREYDKDKPWLGKNKISWSEALYLWNKDQVDGNLLNSGYFMPRKGTSEYKEVRDIMERGIAGAGLVGGCFSCVSFGGQLLPVHRMNIR